MKIKNVVDYSFFNCSYDAMHVLMSEVIRPELEGFGMIDTGAIETVGGLDALECVHRRRTEKLGHSNRVHVMQGPSKNFPFGNGDTKYSESYVLLMQSLGSHNSPGSLYFSRLQCTHFDWHQDVSQTWSGVGYSDGCDDPEGCG